MISVTEAKDLMKNAISVTIDNQIKSNTYHGSNYFQISIGKWNKQLLNEVVAEYEERGWKIDRSCPGFITFSW